MVPGIPVVQLRFAVGLRDSARAFLAAIVPQSNRYCWQSPTRLFRPFDR